MDVINDDAIARRARGLDRAFEILDFLRINRAPMKPNEIATHIGAPRSSVYELVNVLLRNGILEYTDSEKRVYLGRKLYLLGAAYEDQFDFMAECDKVLESIATETRETAQFCMLDGNKYTVVRMREGARPFRISSDVGHRVPIPWTASGRLLVAHMSDDEIIHFIPKEDFLLPNDQWLEPAAFVREVREAEAAGEFTFNSIVDSFTHCFAVPIKDDTGRHSATICLVAPREDGIRNRAHYLAVLKEHAEALGALQLSSRRSAGNHPPRPGP